MTQQLSLDDISNDDPSNDEPTQIAVTYARSKDNTQQQLQQGIDHARNELEYTADTTVNTTVDDKQSGSAAIRHDETDDAIGVMFDNDDTHPGEIEHLIDAAREHAVEDVIVDNLATLSDSIHDVIEIVEIVNEEGATVHALNDNLTIPPGSGEVRAALRAAARTNNDAQPRVTGETHSGRPPAGFEVVNGRLRKADDYGELRNALINVIEHGLSHADAVRETNYSRATIIRCKRQRNRYNLPANDDQ